MGAVYAIECTLKVNRQKAPGDTLREALAKILLKQLNDVTHEEVETLRGCLEIIFQARQRMFHYSEEGDENGYTIYIDSGFDQSYMWESFMTETFEEITPLLEDGSQLYVEPDSDYDLIVVENGVAVQKH